MEFGVSFRSRIIAARFLSSLGFISVRDSMRERFGDVMVIILFFVFLRILKSNFSIASASVKSACAWQLGIISFSVILLCFLQ